MYYNCVTGVKKQKHLKGINSTAIILGLAACFSLCSVSFVRAQSDIRVSYLGPAGTYTEEAAQFFFRDGETLEPMETVNDAIQKMQSGEADYAVIPQENTVGGAVVNYVVGTVWFMVVAQSSLYAALTACVIPFIPTAIIKILLTGFLGTMLRGILIKSNLLRFEQESLQAD